MTNTVGQGAITYTTTKAFYTNRLDSSFTNWFKQ
jgi:hypothetical protein